VLLGKAGAAHPLSNGLAGLVAWLFQVAQAVSVAVVVSDAAGRSGDWPSPR